MIPNWEGWHHLTAKRLSTLLRGKTSEHDGDFYRLNCLHFFRTKNKPKSHKKAFENKEFCGVVMSSKGTNISNILEFIQYQKSDKTPSAIYADLESLIKK